MKAQVIKYSYLEYDDDPHKGLRTWNKTKLAIVIPELSVLVIKWNGKVHFFLMKGFDNKFTLDYYPKSDEVKLPREYEVVREVQVDDQMAKWARNFVDLLSDELKQMQIKWNDVLKQASAGQ